MHIEYTNRRGLVVSPCNGCVSHRISGRGKHRAARQFRSQSVVEPGETSSHNVSPIILPHPVKLAPSDVRSGKAHANDVFGKKRADLFLQGLSPHA